MEAQWDYLSDETEQTRTRYITMVTPLLHRFDLAIIHTSRFYGKKLVMDMMRGRSAIIGPDDLEEPGYLEHTFRMDEEEAHELRMFLEEVIGPISYPE